MAANKSSANMDFADTYVQQLNDEAKAAKSNYDGLRSDLDRGIADYVIPSYSAINTLKTPHTENWTEGIFDTTVIHAQQTFSAGCYEYMLSGEWFDFRSPIKGSSRNEAADDWYRECAEIVMELLNESNFALKIQEHLQLRNSFGFGDLTIEEGKNSFFNFRVSPVGKVFVQEDDEGVVDTRFVMYDWTAKQIIKKFGKDAVSETVREDAEDSKAKQPRKWKVWNKISPRDDSEREHGKIDGQNKPWKSCWWEEDNLHMLQESGFDDKPFVGSRFAQWIDEYGWSPAILILPTVRGLQDLVRDIQALSELKVWPRTLVPSGFKDVIDWAAGGATVYAEGTGTEKPEVWGDGGDYGIGKDMIEHLQQMIKDAYHVDLFKALAERTKQMTATEVLELVEEKLINFRPTFARFTTETLNPILTRCFNMALRAGLLPPVPREVMQVSETGDVSVPSPKSVYVSKIARALRALENRSMFEFFNLIMPMVEIDPNLFFDNYDADEFIRTAGDNSSLPTHLKKAKEQRDEERAARAEQQQAAQQMEMAQMGSQAAKNIGDAGPQVQEALGEAIDI